MSVFVLNKNEVDQDFKAALNRVRAWPISHDYSFLSVFVLNKNEIDQDFEAALNRIRTWPISQDYSLLFEFINNCVWQKDFGKVYVTDSGCGEIEYTFITGGWSDNEEILEALKSQRLAWALTWQRSERGGLHAFKWEKINC